MALFLGGSHVSPAFGDAISVNVHNQSKTITPTKSVQTLVPDPGYTGMSQVTVQSIPSSYIIPEGTLSISSNGTFNVSSYASVEVNLPHYEVYRSIALEQKINSSDPGVSEYCNTVSTIGTWGWGGRKFWGEFNFPNLSSIDNYGLAWAYTNLDTSPTGMYSYSATFNFLDSRLKTLKNGTFYNNKVITSVSSPYITTIETYAFYRATVRSVNLPALTEIKSYGFQQGRLNGTLSFPNLTTIGGQAFAQCGSLTGTLSFPKASNISAGAFAFCYNITGINFPSLVSVPSSCFANCSKLTTISLPNVTFLGSGAFSNCLSLISVNLSTVTQMAMSCFYSCTNLQDVSLPNVTSIGQGGFQQCWALSSIVLNASIMGGYMFNNCSNLQYVSLPNVQSIQTNFFYQCSKLESIYLMNSTLTTLTTAAAFNGTPISQSSYLGYFGSIYVPSSLLTQYKTASNWSAYSSRFVGV